MTKPSMPSTGREGIDMSHHLVLVMLGDCLIAVAAYVAAFLLRSLLPIPYTQAAMPAGRLFQVRHYWWLIILLQPVLLFVFDTYHDLRSKRLREVVLPVAVASGVQALTLIACYFFAGNLTFPRTVFPIYWVLNVAGLTGWRHLIMRGSTRVRRRLLIVGGGPLAEKLAEELAASPELGLEVAGMVSGPAEAAPDAVGPMRDLVRDRRVDEIILMPEEMSPRGRLVASLGSLEGGGPRIRVLPSNYEIMIARIRHINIRDIPLIEVTVDPDDPVARAVLAARDYALAALLAVALLPLWLLVAIAIKLADGGAVVYTQARIGQRGRIFRVFKFRTMPEGAEDATGPVLARKSDPRSTRLGRFLRSCRIDESLQLLNVLRGEMSLVGPRPERPEFVAKLESELPGYAERHRVKPGITGLAQIRGHYHTDPAIKLKYDVAYIYNRSFMLDLVILLETVRIVFRRQGV